MKACRKLACVRRSEAGETWRILGGKGLVQMGAGRLTWRVESSMKGRANVCFSAS